MDNALIFTKTPLGDEAVRQRTRVVQRNLRMVLLQVDGKTSVGELGRRIGNPRLVVAAMRELAAGGYVAPTSALNPGWDVSKPLFSEPPKADGAAGASTGGESERPSFSAFSSPGVPQDASQLSNGPSTVFSSFGKPVLPLRTEDVVESRPPSFKPTTAPAKRADAPPPRTRPLRRRSAKGWLGRLMFFAVVLLVVGVVFFPFEQFKPQIERAAGQYFGVPVKVGEIGLTFDPLPYLKLSAIRLGTAGEGRVAEARIPKPWQLFGDNRLELERLDLVGVDLPPELAIALAGRKERPSAGPGFAIEQVSLERSRFALADGIALTDARGSLQLRADGSLAEGRLENEERTLRVVFRPNGEGLSLEADGQTWRPAKLPFSFSTLQVKAELFANRLVVTDIDAAMLGGMLRGKGVLSWGDGLSISGEASLGHLDAGMLTAAISDKLKLAGTIDGTVKFRSAAAGWDALWRGAESSWSIDMTHGVFHGLDIGEAARRSGVEVRGGDTKFDRLSTQINAVAGKIAIRNVRMNAGLMNAAGQFTTNHEGRVEGDMTIRLQSTIVNLSTPLRISGQLPDLVAVARP